MRRNQILRGLVIGHSVKFLPQQIKDCGSGVFLQKRPKVAAFVSIQVDGQKIYSVPCKVSERILEEYEEPTEAMQHEVNIRVLTEHPFREERAFARISSQDGVGRYKFVE